MKIQIRIHWKVKFIIAVPGIFSALLAVAQAVEPLVDSWSILSGAKYARIYKTQTAALAGSSSSTWTNTEIPVPAGKSSGSQVLPVYGGVQSVRVSTNWVYVQASALPTYVMGPWYLNAGKTTPFPNWPSNQHMVTRFPRIPTNSAAHSTTPLGAIALWVDGGIIHNQLDAFYWNGSYDTNFSPIATQSWQRNANFAEGLSFDPSGSHQPYTGERHHHISPAALRYQLGDHMNYNSTNHTYSENPALTGHSPILGWAFDGYPIYGPYGYANATNTSSAIRRIISGYVARDGSYGTTNLNVTGRTSYPQWALDIGKPNSVNGPNVNVNQPMGWYVQDYDHLADHGFAPGVTNQPGDVFYDLDRYNGRFCKTPEFPNGTYAYFTTVDTNGTPAFPYIIGLQYYGVKTGGDYLGAATVGFTSIETPNYTNFLGGANTATVIEAPQKNGGTVTLTWSNIEGGHYNVEATTNFTTWTTNAANLRAAGNSTAINFVTSASQNNFRVARISLDTYDPVVTP